MTQDLKQRVEDVIAQNRNFKLIAQATLKELGIE